MLCDPALLDMINSHDEVLAQKPDGHMYITGPAERRFRGTYLRCETINDDRSHCPTPRA